MEYQATAKYVRSSTRRVRLVADAIRKMNPATSLQYLDVTTKYAAEPLAKVIRSALANARQANANMTSLRFKRIEVMGGPFLKRMRAVSRGQGHGYKKRMTHICVVLSDSNEQSVKNVKVSDKKVVIVDKKQEKPAEIKLKTEKKSVKTKASKKE